MINNLVIVESPAKAKTLSKILGSSYSVKASLGHVRDLPKNTLGINLEDGFKPQYTILKERRKTVNELLKAAESSQTIFLATDPDREGEAISWHLVKAMKLDEKEKPVHRVTFHEITPDAVKKAFRNPRSIDMDLVNAQQARRLLDRIVGYKLSPLLWKKIMKGLSAGRVQSAAVRIIVDRENEIRNFQRTEYWTIEVILAKDDPSKLHIEFKATLYGLVGSNKLTISNKDEADKINKELSKSFYSVKNILIKESNRQPLPPFITSTLQQEAWWKLRFSASRTMSIAQQLYEGIDLGDAGTVGLITYMRTDSTYVAPSAVDETRQYILDKFGTEYLPTKPRMFGKRNRWSQEAHEAIRPTKIFREPASVRQFLKLEQYKLYELIWKRMLASQMAEAVFDMTNIDINAKSLESERSYLLKTTASRLKFPGFMTIYAVSKDDGIEDDINKVVPDLEKGEKLLLRDILQKQNFTEPPPRYNEATLIKALEQKGIGRPSTYAPIISTIQERNYVFKENGKFRPNEIGEIVNGILIQHFPNIVDLDFTANIEDNLDKIAAGKIDWVSVLKEFYISFNNMLEEATNNLSRIKIEKASEQICPECGKPMLIKYGRFGEFLACSGYPECRKTLPLLVKTGVSCPECGDLGQGELVERKDRKRKIFYGCSRYPECRFTIRQKPFSQKCPKCNKLMIYGRKNKVTCTNCKFSFNPENIFGDLAEK